MNNEEDSLEDDRYFKKKLVLNNMIHSRYLFRKSTYRKDRKSFDIDDALSFDSKNFNTEEFLLTFRILRESFFLLLDEMKDKRAFKRKSKKNNHDPLLFSF